MLDEKLLKAANDMIEGIVETGGVNDDGFNENIKYILRENGIEEFIEDENEDEIENPKYEKIKKELEEKIIGDERLQVFEPDIYAWDGEIKTLNFTYVCSSKYETPFEAMEEEY